MTITILSGPATSSYVLNAGDVLSVVQGGVASGVVVNSGGEEILLSGGVDSGASVQSGGQIFVAGGSAVGDVVASGGSAVISSGGTMTGGEVLSGGGLTISSGGTASALVLPDAVSFVSGDYINVQGTLAGGLFMGDVFLSNGVISGGTLVGGTILEEGTASISGLTVDGGSVDLDGGVGSNFVVASGVFGAAIDVSSGAELNGVVVSSGAHLFEEGGAVSGAAISGGIEYSDGLDVGTRIYAGGVQFAATGMSGTVVFSGGRQVVEGGVQVDGVLVAAGGLQAVLNGFYTFGDVLSAVSVDAVVSGIGAGENVAGTNFDASELGGMTSSSTLVAGGFEIVSSGGIAVATTVAVGGTLVALPGAVVSGTVLDGGEVVSTGVVWAQPYQALGVEGASASGLNVSSGGQEYVMSGGTVTGGTVSGTQFVYSGGVVSGVTVVSGGQVYEPPEDGLGVYVPVPGDVYVLAGGSASNITASAGGKVSVAGGTASGVAVASGGMLIEDKLGAVPTVDGLVVMSGGSAFVEGPAILDNPTIAGGMLQLDEYTADVTVGNISFSGAGGVLEVDGGLTGTLFGFGLGDTIDVDEADLGLSGTIAATLGAGNVLSATVDGQVLTYNLDPNADYAADQILVNGTELTLEALCLCRGTRLATPWGEVAVEDLAVGEMVATDVGPRRVRWIGRRGYDGRFIAGNVLVLPVCIKPGALGRGVPLRELFVSPGHGICVEGVLVPAWRLVNGVSVQQAEAVERVEYFHVELDGHGILFAEGAPVESYLEIGTRGLFQAARGVPGFGVVSCLPRVEGGFWLSGIQSRIDRRAGVAARQVQPGPLRGFVDRVAPRLAGWAQDVLAPEAPVALDVLCEGRVVARVLANDFRADLRAAGLGSGCHGFEVALPAGLGEVVVRRRRDGAVVKMAEGAARFRSAMAA